MVGTDWLPAHSDIVIADFRIFNSLGEIGENHRERESDQRSLPHFRILTRGTAASETEAVFSGRNWELSIGRILSLSLGSLEPGKSQQNTHGRVDATNACGLLHVNPFV